MGRGVSERTKKLTLGAILASMGVVLLTVGGLVEVLDLSMAALASFFCIFAVIEMGKGYPLMIYAVTGILAVLIMPQSLSGWIYLLFFGYYPIVKAKLERLPTTLAWVLKLAVFNAAVTVYAAICYFLFFGELELLLLEFSTLFGGMNIGGVLVAIIYAILNVIFVVYDIAITRIITLYLIKLRHRFRFLK
ncbi:MAG: hypothetical protein IKJ24_03065 [Clostridia bacterium]|nr:hypothetical protein [Clostridia bacterium]